MSNPSGTADDEDQAGRDQPTSIALDSRALQVLAHPLRSRLLSALRTGDATATALAAALDTNTGATSYHLRKLAEVGLVTETGEGRGRERWWRASTQMHSWRQRSVATDPDGRAATDWLRRHYFQSFADSYQDWLNISESWPIEWQDAAGSSDYMIEVGPARLEQFNAEVLALFDRYRERAPDDPDARTVSVHMHAFPMTKRPR